MQPDVDDSVVLVDDFPPEDSLGDLDDLVGLLDTVDQHALEKRTPGLSWPNWCNQESKVHIVFSDLLQTSPYECKWRKTIWPVVGPVLNLDIYCNCSRIGLPAVEDLELCIPE